MISGSQFLMYTFVLVVGILLLGSAAYAGWRGAPWVPMRRGDAARLARLLALKPGERFLELGCGDGRVTVAVAKQSGASATGVELSLLQFFAAWIRGRLARVPGVSFRLGDAFSSDVSHADGVYLFLMPETYEKIRPKLEAELKPGARVVTYVWPMPEWKVAQEDQVEGKPALYLYVR